MKGFLERHKELSCRKPESLSVARASGLNEQVIDKWFAEYEKELDYLGIKDCPTHIWNTDESGLQDYFVSHTVVGLKGKPCYEVNPGEKGETTTVLATFNAVGTYAPLLFIFKGKRLKAEWCVGAPVDSIVRVSDNGWITSELFVEFAKKFVSSLPKNDPKPHLLLLDGHRTHVYNMDFLSLMKENNVYPFCFPPHTTHCLQPADVALFKSVKHNWTAEGRKHMRENGGRKPDKKQFFKLFQCAWTKAATIETAQSGFRETGTFPVNRKAIKPEVFAPSQTSERQLDCEPAPPVPETQATRTVGPSMSVEVAQPAEPVPDTSATSAAGQLMTAVVAEPVPGPSGKPLTP